MHDDKVGSKLIGRRRTLQLLGVGLATGGSLLAVGGCKDDSKGGGATSGGEAPGTSAKDCRSSVDDASKQLRRTLQYKAEAVDAAKKCKVCVQFQKGAYGDCGGCKLFTGPVNPEGGCLSFAPIGSDAAPAVPN